MPIFVKLGGGGVPYNFKVTRYDTLANRPASAAENEIVVIAPLDIPSMDSGGIVFKMGGVAPLTRTTGAASVAGDLWFACGESALTSFVGVTGIVLSGQLCFQFNGSTYTQALAFVMKSGVWVPFEMSLYKEGNEQSALTGGFQGRVQTIEGTVGSTPITFTKNASNMTLYATSTGNKSCVIEPLQDIDVTAANTLNVEMAASAAGNGIYLFAVKRDMADYYSGAAAVAKFTSAFTRQVKSVSIAPLSGKYNLCVGFRLSNGTVTITLNNFWLS